MKLVLIQGRYLARYEGRQQLETVLIERWDGEFDYKGFVEDYRTTGSPDDVQAQHG